MSGIGTNVGEATGRNTGSSGKLNIAQPIGDWILPAGHFEPSHNPLEIISPQPSLTTTSVFYFAYPAIQYEVKVGAIGGAFPYNYTLTTSPPGMTINSATGVITWSNPTTSGSPHTVTANVEDQERTSVQRTWTVSVDANQFIFIDPNASIGGTGTIGDPIASIGEVFKTSNTDATYQNKIIYWRDGSQSGGITINPFDFNAGVLSVDRGGFKVTFLEQKPRVWLAYPGESPEIDWRYYIQFLGIHDTCMYGLKINGSNNGRCLAIQLPANDRVTIGNNTFLGLVNPDTLSFNYSYIFTTRTAGNFGQFHHYHNNGATDGLINSGYWYIGYTTNKQLIENNTLIGNGNHPIGPKESNTNYYIRQNTITNPGNNSINDQYASGSGASGPAEISYNLCLDGTLNLNSNAESVGEPVHCYRNTLIDLQSDQPNGTARQSHSLGVSGPFTWKNNVIVSAVNPVTFPDLITWASAPTAQLVRVDNLTGPPADSITDANGLLQNTYRTTYLGIRGHEISA